MSAPGSEREGVVRYRLEYTPGPAPSGKVVAALDSWRHVLFCLGLIGGGDPARYHGLGFGNVSVRVPGAGFIISGTQTGHLPHAGARHYAVVSACDPAANRIVAGGPVKPSSEALTHGAVYAALSDVNCVLHAHHPAIWRHARVLGIPATPPEVPYGTPEMAASVATLCHSDAGGDGIFVMAGHEDGVVSYGVDEQQAGTRLVAALARAIAIEPGA